MGEPLEPVDTTTFQRLLRYALRAGADRLHLRPGCRPQITGLGGVREVRFRQLTGCDTGAIAAQLLEGVRIPDRLQPDPGEGGHALGWWVELPGEALLEVAPAVAPGGLALRIDLIRACQDAAGFEILDF